MICQKCGKENITNSKFCVGCGEKLSNNIKSAKFKWNKKSIITITVVFVLFLCSVLFFSLKKTTPSIKKLKEDFSKEYFEGKEYSFDDFEIVSENKEIKNKYTAVVKTVYSNKNVQYSRQYEFAYNKYKKWTLSEINGFQESSWTKKPITVPDVSDYINVCKQEWQGDIEIETFVPLKEKTKADLENGNVTFVFNVGQKTKILNLSGDIEFDFKFDQYSENWEFVNFTETNSYKVNYDITKTWFGKGQPLFFENLKDNYVDFTFQITKCDGKSVEGILTYNGKDYNLKGILSTPNRIDQNIFLELINEEAKKKMEVYIYPEGNIKADINIDYTPDDIIYFGYMKTKFQNVEMNLK